MLGLLALAACSDALEQTTSAGQVVVAVNAVSDSLSLVEVGDYNTSALALPPARATPRSVAVAGGGGVLAVPAGDSSVLVVFDFSNGGTPVITRAPLPPGSGATGAAFDGDSTIWVANPNRNSVTRVRLRTGDTATFAAGVYPQAVAFTQGLVFIVNGNLVGGNVAGPSWITVRSRDGSLPVIDSIPLSGTNAHFVTVGADGLLYVVDAGRPGKGEGKLSIVDPVAEAEVAVLNGLGESPGAAVYHSSGRLLVASATEGILEVNTSTRTVTRGPGNGVQLGSSVIAALALDQSGRVYALDQKDCVQQGVMHVLSAPPEYEDVKQVPVGVCPSAAATILKP